MNTVTDAVIAVEGLGKSYVIRHEPRHDTLRDALAHGARGVIRRVLRGSPGPSREEFWALYDVSFAVNRGEVVGIIGRNGAGKSTLLKILSRITEPTAGLVHLDGRVVSLLEVGTGFHPELSGRENVYLNGVMLGMSRGEIHRKFDEIVAFAEVERFLDTPVKRYSSGMYMRLAFAVAAHLEPEILIVDEVLAVGDSQFQKKCIGKMGEVARGGRTVLFVSHNMPAVTNLCTRCILLDSGHVVQDGAVDAAIQGYLNSAEQSANVLLRHRKDRKGNGVLRFTSYEILGPDGARIDRVHAGQPIVIALEYEAAHGASIRNVHVSIGVHGQQDEALFHMGTDTTGGNFDQVRAAGVFHCHIPSVPLQPGKYPLNVFCSVNGVVADWVEHAVVLEADEGDFFGSGRLPPSSQGPFLVPHRWECLARKIRSS